MKPESALPRCIELCVILLCLDALAASILWIIVNEDKKEVIITTGLVIGGGMILTCLTLFILWVITSPDHHDQN